MFARENLIGNVRGLLRSRFSRRGVSLDDWKNEHMPRFLALLRGVSPMNLKMAELKGCLESAGYSGVRTVLSSGNVAFDAPKITEAKLASTIETQMQKNLGRSFPVTVRSSDYLRKLAAEDPYQGHLLPSCAKRVVTFLHSAHKGKLVLPVEQDGACILAVRGAEVFIKPCAKYPKDQAAA